MPPEASVKASSDGAAQLGAVLRQNSRVITCLMRNFYRNANGRAEDDKDPDQIDSLVQSLAARSYVWSNLLADFVASDAFRSAPALPVNREHVNGNPEQAQVLSATCSAWGMVSGVGVVPVAAGAGHHVQRKRHRVRAGSAVAHDVRHLLLGQRYLPGVALDADRDGRRGRLAAPDEPLGFRQPQGLHDARDRARHDGRRVQGTWLGRGLRAGRRRRHDLQHHGDISKSPYGGLPETSQGTQWQPTIDQLVANAIHTNEPYKSLETGILKYTGMNMGTASLNLAHLGPNMPLAPERDPGALFNKLFSTGAPPTTGAGCPIDISNKLRRSVLDAVLADAKRLQMTVGSADAKRIDAHMESIRSLEMRIPPRRGTATSRHRCRRARLRRLRRRRPRTWT